MLTPDSNRPTGCRTQVRGPEPVPQTLGTTSSVQMTSDLSLPLDSSSPFPKCESTLTYPPRGHSAIRGTVTSSKDVDVEKEQVRVLEGRTGGDILVLYNLSKGYRGFFKRATAVSDISLGLHRGEVRELLFVPFLLQTGVTLIVHLFVLVSGYPKWKLRAASHFRNLCRV